jgi:hypothetical protein
VVELIVDVETSVDELGPVDVTVVEDSVVTEVLVSVVTVVVWAATPAARTENRRAE